METISEIALWFFIVYPLSIASFSYVGIYSLSKRKLECGLHTDDIVSFLQTKGFPANMYLHWRFWELARPVIETSTNWSLSLFRILLATLGVIISYVTPVYTTWRDINLGVELHPLQIPMFIVLMISQTLMLWFAWRFGKDLCINKP